MTENHDEIRSLLGAFSLGAVSPLESREIRLHLEVCTDCAREARLLAEAAGELAFLPGPEPVSAQLVDSVVAAIGPNRRASFWTKTLAGIAAAAVLVAGLLGAAYLRERGRADSFAKVVAGAEQVELRGVDGFPGEGSLHVSDREIGLALENMPPAGKARTYQLWSLRRSGPVSVSLFEPSESRIVKVFDWPGDGRSFAVSIEPEGGSDSPRGEIVLRTFKQD